jgi:DNA polymerase IIIc chi subunit
MTAAGTDDKNARGKLESAFSDPFGATTSDKFNLKSKSRYSQPWAVNTRAKKDYRFYSSMINTRVDILAYQNTKNRNLEDYLVKQLGKSSVYKKMDCLLKCMKEASEEKTDHQIWQMQAKNEKMMKVINELYWRVKQDTKTLETLQKDLKRLKALTGSEQVDFSETRFNSLAKRVDATDDLSKRARKQFKRLQKIIGICYINKDINEEWIRQLNYF